MVHAGLAPRHSKEKGGIAMTRRSIATALASLLVSLSIAFNATAVRADLPCEGSGYAPERCASMTVARDATLNPVPSDDPSGTTVNSYSMGTWQGGADDATAFAGSPVHILAGSGMGQEQFEATEASGFGTFLIAVPMSALVHSDNEYTLEHDQRMLAQQPSN
jgi:hypothetical protein